MIYIKTGNILGFQFTPVPLPPFRTLLFIRGSGWNPLFTPPMTHLSSLNHGHLSCKPQAFEELRCVVQGAEMRHWNCRNVQGFHPLPRINRRVRKGGRGWHESNMTSTNNCNWSVQRRTLLKVVLYSWLFIISKCWILIYIKSICHSERSEESTLFMFTQKRDSSLRSEWQIV